MARIKLVGEPGAMRCKVTEVPAFPGERFALGYPEAVGDAARAYWFTQIKPEWEKRERGVLVSAGEYSGQVSYVMTLTPEAETVTVHFQLTNQSKNTWKQGMTFNCVQCADAPSLRDHDCLRHWVGVKGRPRRLAEVPRVCGPRPAVQLYSVEGAPPGAELPFVAKFRATPDIVLEPWMAIVSRDGKKLLATASRPGLFLFQNREYSCIHCANGFGEVKPGETVEAVNKVYFLETSLDHWYRKERDDFMRNV